MTASPTSESIFSGLYPDQRISFHIERTPENISRFPRNVVTIQDKDNRLAIVPGVARQEIDLIRELRSIQNWRFVEKHSFEVAAVFYSFLWRFIRSTAHSIQHVQERKALDPKVSKRILAAYKIYQSALRSALRPGQVFRIPDEAVTFNKPDRLKKPYARRLLVVQIKPDQLIIMPFSKQVHRLNPKTDILFDKDNRLGRLDMNARPAVENFPYQIFRRKVYLSIMAEQTMTVDQFLLTALEPLGPVRPQLLNFVLQKLQTLKQT